MKTVIVIPTYNEAENLPAIAEALWALPLAPEILIVDDASPDGTGRLAEDLAAQRPGYLSVLHRPAKLGLGTAYVQGFQRALEIGADIVVQMDADFSHSPTYIPKLIEHLVEYDVVIGSRYTLQGRLDEKWDLGRVWLSAWGNWYARVLLGVQVRDATAGFKAWRSATLLGLGLERIRSNGYVFQVEMAYVAQRLGYRTLEIPIYFEDRRIGHSKMDMRIKIEAAWRVWEVAMRHHRLTPRDRKA